MTTLNSLRQDLLQKRLDLHKDLEIRDALEKSLIKYLDQFDQGCLAIYWPINSEFDPRPLALNWARQHPTKKLALPIVKINQPLIFEEWQDGDKLEKGPQGIPQPILRTNSSEGIQPNIILLPCLGWSSHAEKVLSIKPLKYVLAPMVVMVVVIEKTLIVAYLLLKANCL